MVSCAESIKYTAIEKPRPAPIDATYKKKCLTTVPPFKGRTAGDYIQYTAYRWQEAYNCAVTHNKLVDKVNEREAVENDS